MKLDRNSESYRLVKKPLHELECVPDKVSALVNENVGRGVPNHPHLWAWAVHVASAQVVFVILFGAVALHTRILES